MSAALLTVKAAEEAGSFDLSVGMGYLAIAVLAYLLGCTNGALIGSKLFYHDDVRTHGSGNAGLTNFYRSYGAKYALFVIGCDMGKAVLSIGVSILFGNLFRIESAVIKYWAGFFCILGHVFPVTEKFRGGKGVLCGAALLFLIDWRIGLVSAILFLTMWIPSEYVSLGSVAAAAAFPVTTWIILKKNGAVWPEKSAFLISLAMALLVIWAHRENIKRLIRGTENKTRLSFRKSASEGKR